MPREPAFAAIPETQRDQIFSDRERLARVMCYHIVEGEVTPEELLETETLETLLGEPIQISFLGYSDEPQGTGPSASIVPGSLMVYTHITVDGRYARFRANDARLFDDPGSPLCNGRLYVVDRLLLP